MSNSTTLINWFNGTTLSTTEIYAHYGFSAQLGNTGYTVEAFVWEIITKGSCNPIVNGAPAFTLTPTLVTDEPAPAVETVVEPAPVVETMIEPAPVVETVVEPAPVVETVVEPAPVVETVVVLERRDLDEEQELVELINKACYMQGACTRGLACYDAFEEEYGCSWITLLDESAGALGAYLNQTAFRSRGDKRAQQKLESVLDKANRKLDKYCGQEA